MARVMLQRFGRHVLAKSRDGSLCPSRTFYMYTPEPFHPYPHREPVWNSAEEAVRLIKSGDRVYIHSAAATPFRLVQAMTEHGKKAKLRDVEVIHLYTMGDALYAEPDCDGIFRSNSLFMGQNVYEAVNSGRADYVPIFLSEIPLLFRRRVVNLDVALVSLSPPDHHGYCSLGPSVDCTRSAIENAKIIIGLCNKQMPRTFGDSMVHKSHVDVLVEDDAPLFTRESLEPTADELAIGVLIAENLVEDGATLQMGLGSIPNIVLQQLKHHRNLGVHSEMIGDAVIDLVEQGAITNHMKVIRPGKVISGFAVGTKRMYDFLNNNPFVELCDVAFTNSTTIICQNPKVTSINSCIEVDLTGQVVADSIGDTLYSGVGGQVDFIRGAALGLDGQGKAIIALCSRTKDGESKIVPFIKKGSGVVTTRAHVHYIVTEYGIANLFGKSLRQRAHALIEIAHPDDQADLEKAAFERLKCMPSP